MAPKAAEPVRTNTPVQLRYATHEDAVIELFGAVEQVPEAHLVILLHGGFWRSQYDRRGARPLAAALAAESLVVALPEYRRVRGTVSKGVWPTTAHDLVSAMAAIRQHLQHTGTSVARTTVVGHSAGGQLALWLGCIDAGVDAVVGLAPVADLRECARLNLGCGAVQAFLGGSPEEIPNTYDDADPVTVLRAESRHPREVVLVHGLLDDIVPVEVSARLVEAQPEVRLIRLPDMDHFGLIDPESSAWPTVLAAARGELGGDSPSRTAPTIGMGA